MRASSRTWQNREDLCDRVVDVKDLGLLRQNKREGIHMIGHSSLSAVRSLVDFRSDSWEEELLKWHFTFHAITLQLWYSKYRAYSLSFQSVLSCLSSLPLRLVVQYFYEFLRHIPSQSSLIRSILVSNQRLTSYRVTTTTKPIRRQGINDH